MGRGRGREREIIFYMDNIIIKAGGCLQRSRGKDLVGLWENL